MNTVSDLFTKVGKLTGHDLGHFLLVYQNKALENKPTQLSDLALHSGSRMCLIIRLKGSSNSLENI
jgi:ABC-type thiamine transport system substrate-binding protein